MGAKLQHKFVLGEVSILIFRLYHKGGRYSRYNKAGRTWTSGGFSRHPCLCGAALLTNRYVHKHQLPGKSESILHLSLTDFVHFVSEVEVATLSSKTQAKVMSLTRLWGKSNCMYGAQALSLRVALGVSAGQNATSFCEIRNASVPRCVGIE